MTSDQSRMDGALIIDKPWGPTSHDIVVRVRKIFKTKAGHTGTLDPLATGVLPVLLGRATRLARFFQAVDKEYLAELELGKTTATYDGEGEILQEKPVPPISRQGTERILERFVGRIDQRPPLFSAVKVKGQKLYEIARRKATAGDEIARLELQRPSRSVFIRRLELVEQGPARWKLVVECSSGTYVRTLVHEIGQAIGCGAYLLSLRRLRSGNFDLSHSIASDALERDWSSGFFPLEELLADFPIIQLDRDSARLARHGQALPLERTDLRGHCRLFFADTLIAIAEAQCGRIQPSIVFPPES